MNKITRMLYDALKKPLGLSDYCTEFTMRISMDKLPEVTQTHYVDYKLEKTGKELDEVNGQLCMVEAGTDKMVYGPDKIAVAGDGKSYLLRKYDTIIGTTVWESLTKDELEKLECVPYYNGRPFVINLDNAKNTADVRANE